MIYIYIYILTDGCLWTLAQMASPLVRVRCRVRLRVKAAWKNKSYEHEWAGRPSHGKQTRKSSLQRMENLFCFRFICHFVSVIFHLNFLAESTFHRLSFLLYCSAVPSFSQHHYRCINWRRCLCKHYAADKYSWERILLVYCGGLCNFFF